MKQKLAVQTMLDPRQCINDYGTMLLDLEQDICIILNLVGYIFIVKFNMVAVVSREIFTLE